MRKGIILVTKHFPFNKGETPAESYLENEIKTLAQGVERVFVIAAEAKQGSQITCSLPSNVKYAALQSEASKSVKLACCAKAVTVFFRGKPQEIKAETEDKKLSFKQKMFLFYYAKRAEQKLTKIENLIENKTLDLSEYDTLYSYWFFDNAYMMLKLAEKYSLNNYKIVSRAHGYDLYEYRNSLNYIPLRKFTFSGLNRVLTCSQNGKEYLTEKYPDFSDKITVSYLGSVDYSEQKYTRKENTLRIASCSRLVALKRVHRIIEALSELEGKGFNLEWTHFGGGALFDEIKSEAESKLKKTKYYLKGNMSNVEVMKNYSELSTDVFINVSETEGLPISIMEASSFGIPVLATDVGGTAEIVVDGKNGFLLTKDFTNDKLCNLLEKIAGMSDDEYMTLRKNSRQMYVENFECSRNVERFLNLLDK